ncbi:CHAT domain-containing protein [Actinomadura roseirufa]|uniref:CHAT domain-containing protein n=1 Tax=Actinomadura roseirufa TaxID=2094049 RepID=UPI0013F1488A|nr:CHAT domain-containing protein [Actinomadura roseirufa]
MAERDTAVALFARCLLAGVTAGELPGELLDEIVNRAGQDALPWLREAVRTRDPSTIEEIVGLWRLIAAACRETHPHRPALLTNLAVVLQARGAVNESAEDDREVVHLLEEVVDATPEDFEGRAQRLFNLGVARRRIFDSTGDVTDLDEAIKRFQQALDSAPEDDPGRQDTYAALGEAYRVRAAHTDFSFDELAPWESHRTRSITAVYAVCELINAPGLDRKKQVIERSPELRDRLALKVLDDLIEDAEALGDESPLSVPSLQVHRKILVSLQEGGPEEPSSAGGTSAIAPSAAPPWVAEARTLSAEGRIDEAASLLREAAERAQRDADPHAEGHAELALHDLVFDSLYLAPGSVQRLDRHAGNAQQAFRKAGDRHGLLAALRRRMAVAVQFQDGPMAQDVMMRLLGLDPYGGVWWNTYMSAIGSDDLQYRRAQLQWCVDRAWRLGPDAAHYRAVCERKLAFLDGQAATEDLALPGDLAALVESVERRGPNSEDGERLTAALERVERMRSHAQSATVQRGLSAVYTPAYRALSLCVASDPGDPGAMEASVDVLERNSSRTLLMRMAGGADDALAQTVRTAQLDEQVGTYLRDPTPHHRRLLTLAFDKEREMERHTERGVLRGVAGPGKGPEPVTVAGLRELLGDDAVLFFGGMGHVVLITASGQERIAAFAPAAVDREADALFQNLSKGTPGPGTGLSILDALLPRIRESLAEDSRLFVVPYGRLWRVPLGNLGERRLSDDYKFSAVPSLSVLAELLRTVPEPGGPDGPVFSGFADPDGTLPYARAEVDAAAARYRRARVRAGGDATVDGYRAAVAGSDVIHLACHGFHLPGYPDFTALRLAGPRPAPAMLWYSDIIRTRLTASLVVLGACHAGTGEVLSGAEYAGIPGALLAAGARSVLAPLWAVDDQVTARLLESFHAAYADTRSPATALREAQRTFDADSPDRTGSVHAFQLFGAS